ncbi:MAG: transposase [Anaerolineae bacterium]
MKALQQQQGQRTLVLVVDETKLKAALGVMVVGLVYEGRCIPLAWRVYGANKAEDYPAEGQTQMILGLLEQVRVGLPAEVGRQVRVRVLADRGIGTSSQLMRGIMSMGWTFLFRVTKQSKLLLANGRYVTFYDQVQQPGQHYQASGLVFKKRGRLPAHVRVWWGLQAQEPWALVTNDPSLTGWEYAQRMWIEQAFRDLKSHGWQTELANLHDPERLSRLWILLVVAYAWMLLLGAAVVALGKSAPLKHRPDGSCVRRWSLFREGRQAFLTACSPF